jgi:hypothetical protein
MGKPSAISQQDMEALPLGSRSTAQLTFMKLITATLLFLAFSFGAFANKYWQKDYAKVDAFARSVKASNKLKELSETLTSPYKTDVEQYRSVFTWVATHIAFDCKEAMKLNPKNLSPSAVLKKGKGMSVGYATLFKELCELSGLECAFIAGWPKTHEAQIGLALPRETSHAWNAIKLEGKWYFCDVTWAAGQVNEDLSGFTFDFKDFFFCTPAGLFSRNHFPAEKHWATKGGVTYQEFINLPVFEDQAFLYEVQQHMPENGTLHYCKEEAIKFELEVSSLPEEVGFSTPFGDDYHDVDFKAIDDHKITFCLMMPKYQHYLALWLDGQEALFYKVRKKVGKVEAKPCAVEVLAKEELEPVPDSVVEPKFPTQLPRIYKHYFGYNQNQVDDENERLQEFLSEVKEYLKEEPSISLTIESSASKVPTKAFANNQELAVHRANKGQRTLFTLMEDYGIDVSRIHFGKPVTKVQGPAYNAFRAKSKPEDYTKFQYIRVSCNASEKQAN